MTDREFRHKVGPRPHLVLREFDDPGSINLVCINCNRESHFLGIYCWWSIWMLVPVLFAFVAVIVYGIWVGWTAG